MSEDEVLSVWLNVANLTSEHCAGLSAQLSAFEIAHAGRFHRLEDRHAYVAAHALKRNVLSKLTGLAPAELRFQLGRNGKPEMDCTTTSLTWRFNLSHTRSAVAIALARRHDVGVDIERIDAQRLASEMDMFSARERADLHALAGAERIRAAFALWTLKEASLKALGLGIDQPITQLTVSLEALHISGLHDCNFDPAYWQMHSQPIAGDHILAVAIRRCHIEPVRLRVLEFGIQDLI